MRPVLFICLPLLAVMAGCSPTDRGMDFSHKRHAPHAGGCETCHELDFGEFVPVSHDTCRPCHRIIETAPGEQCRTCHATLPPEPLAREARPAYKTILFDHEIHRDNKIGCEKCHGRVAAQRTRHFIRFMAMAGCINCHFPGTGTPRGLDCRFCHPALNPDSPPASHSTGQWQTLHGPLEGRTSPTCRRCHADRDCLLCHKSTQPRDHNPVFKKRAHGARAAISPDRCSTCHMETFCIACHTTTPPDYHTAVFRDIRPYTHCGVCHFPPESGNRCNACHKQVRHLRAKADATPVPPFVDKSQPCFFCHPVAIRPVQHLYNTVPDTECTICHK